MAAAHKGSWLGLPDLGATEWLQRKIAPKTAYASSGGSNLIGPQQAPAQTTSTNVLGANQAVYGPVYNGPQTQKVASTGGGTPNPTPNPGPQNPGVQDPTQSGIDNGNNQIDSDYNNFMSQLSGSEGSINTQAGIAGQELQNSFNAKNNAVNQEGSAALAGNAGQVVTAQNTEKKGMMGARDLFRQQQQNNIIGLSGQGLSSSSVAQALAETLGVETARRIASVAQTAGDVYQALAKEKTGIETYVKQKLTEATDWLGTETQKIQYGLSEGLRQINEARATAAINKSNQRADLLQSANEARYKLQQDAQTFQQSLDAWKAQNTTKIQQLISDPNVLASITNQQADLNKLAAPGYAYQPEVGANNNFTGWQSTKLPTDENGNPITAAAQVAKEGDVSPDGKSVYSNGKWVSF